MVVFSEKEGAPRVEGIGVISKDRNALLPNLGYGSKTIKLIVILLKSVGCTHFIGIMYFTVKFQRHFK